MGKLDPIEFSSRLLAYKKKELTDTESREVENILRKHPELKAISDELDDKDLISKNLSVFQSFDAGKAYKNIRPTRHKVRLSTILRMVAAILILSIPLAALIKLTKPKEELLSYYVANTEDDSNSVILKLANGQKFNMDTLRVYEPQNKVAMRNLDGQLWIFSALANVEQGLKTQTNILTVPFKKTYKVVLNDSSRVYLNAGSTLEFPSDLNKGDRIVKLNGEAKFEVTHRERQKFIVLMPELFVEVLGTVFNVKAYSDEEKTVVTLLSGHIAISTKTGEYRRIDPGQQVTYNKTNGKLDVRFVDARIYTAWTDKTFLFKEMPLEEIMRRVGRWYGLNIIFKQSNLKNIEFSGKMKTYESVDEVLRKFEESGDVHFELNESSITVSRQ
jgi:transmembrane sensor